MTTRTSRYLISSRFRTSGTPSSFSIQTQHKFQGDYRLISCVIPTSFYTVNNYNQNIPFTISATFYTAQIAIGFYSSTTIASAVQTALNAQSSGFTVTLNSTTNVLTIANATSFVLNFGTHKSNSSANLLGFNWSDTTSTTSAVGNSAVDLAPYNTFNIRINQLTNIENSNSNAFTFCVPITSYINSLNYWEPFNTEWVITFPTITQNLNIAILDEFGHPITLSGNWSMVLEKL